MANNPSRFAINVTIASRAAELGISNLQFLNGTNGAAPNTPGIGLADSGDLATLNLEQSLPSWTLLDQFELPRTPQLSRYIANADGTDTAPTEPIRFVANDAAGDGLSAALGAATLADLAVGWTAVP